MIVKYEFAIRKGPGEINHDYEKMEERRHMDKAPYEIGKMVVDKVRFTHVEFREQDLYKTEAVAFSLDDWVSFCKQLRAVDYLKCADDLIKQLESK